jgi:hypothetical protein
MGAGGIMAKQSGLGDNLYVDGYDLSGDIGSLSRIGGGPSALEFTGINKSAFERKGGLRDGEITFDAYFNPTTDETHDILGDLPTVDVHGAYFRGTALGGEACCIVAKQTNYDGNRNADGSFIFTTQLLSNSFGVEWCNQLTAGKRTDTTATNGTGVDFAASTAFGWQAYLQVFSLTGTNVIVTLEDSADNVNFTPITGGAFTSVTAAPGKERLQGGRTATVRRYVRAVTTGTFTGAVFAVAFAKNVGTVNF